MKATSIFKASKFAERRQVFSLKDDHIDTFLGVLIGIGGTNELSAIGMIVWTAVNCYPNWSDKAKHGIKWQDLIITSIAILCLCFYSFSEIPGDTSGLTTVEFLKIAIWALFSLTLIRSKAGKLYSLINGIGLGLWVYVLIILSGSLAVQPFQGARGMMYNIITSKVNASSSITGYTCASAALIFLGTNSRLLIPTSATCLVLGIHSLNRVSLLVGIIVFTYLALSKIYLGLNKLGLKEASIRKWPAALLIVSFLLIAVLMGKGSIINVISSFTGQIDIAERMQKLDSDPRYYLYNAGFALLVQSIINNNFEIMLNTNEAVSGIYPNWTNNFSEPGWHSLILDSARGAGWIGLLMSITWLTGIVYSSFCAAISRNSRYLLIGIIQVLILVTSMPVALGHYELLGALTLTTLLIYSAGKGDAYILQNKSPKSEQSRD